MADDGKPGSNAGEGNGEPPEGTGEGMSPADVSRLRNEAAGLRRRASEAEAERDRLKEATQSEAEQARERAAKAETRASEAADRLRTASLRAEVGLLAGKLGIDRPDVALRFVDRDAVTFDDEGQADAKSVERALKAAIDDFPRLRRTGDADAGAGGASGGDGGEHVASSTAELSDRIRQMRGRTPTR